MGAIHQRGHHFDRYQVMLTESTKLMGQKKQERVKMKKITYLLAVEGDCIV